MTTGERVRKRPTAAAAMIAVRASAAFIGGPRPDPEVGAMASARAGEDAPQPDGKAASPPQPEADDAASPPEAGGAAPPAADPDAARVHPSMASRFDAKRGRGAMIAMEGGGREKEEDRPPAGVSLCLVLHLIMIVLSSIWLSSMQEIEFDDMAKRDWVAGECLVVGVTMRQIEKGEIMSTWAAEPTAEPTAEPAAASEMRRMLESRQLKSSSSSSSSSSARGSARRRLTSQSRSDKKWRVIVHVERSAILGDSDAGSFFLVPWKARPPRLAPRASRCARARARTARGEG